MDYPEYYVELSTSVEASVKVRNQQQVPLFHTDRLRRRQARQSFGLREAEHDVLCSGRQIDGDQYLHKSNIESPLGDFVFVDQ